MQFGTFSTYIRRRNSPRTLLSETMFRRLSCEVVGQCSKLSQHFQVKVDLCQENNNSVTSEAPSFTVIMKDPYTKEYLLVIPTKYFH